MQAYSYGDIDRHVAALFLTYTYGPRIGHSHQFLMSDREGFGKPCSYSLYVPLRSDGFPAMDKILLDTFKCSTINWKCRHHYRNHHYHITTTTITTTNITTMTTTTTDENIIFTCFILSSERKSRKKASFSHLKNSHFEGSLAPKLGFHIFNFHFWGKSPTKTFFSHPPLSDPTTHSGKICTLPCLALTAHLR